MPAPAHALAPVPPAPPPRPREALATSARRVLLVEDDPLQARGLLRLLEACGLTCHSVPSGAAALEAIASQPAIEFVEDLPKTATGKIQRFLLREREAARRGA